MKKGTRFKFLILFCFYMIICSLSSNFTYVYADNDEEFTKELKNYLGHKPSEKEKYNYSLIISTCKADGLTDIAIAGILGNMAHESGGCEYSIEGYYGGKKTKEGKTYAQFKEGKTYDYGNTEPFWYKSGAGGVGIGLIQWSHGRAKGLNDFAIKHKDKFGYVTVTHWIRCGSSDCKIGSFCPKTKSKRKVHIPNRAGQAAFMVKELNEGYKSVKTSLMSAKSTNDATDIFLDRYEIPSDPNKTRDARRKSASKVLKAVKACDGVSGSGGSSKNNSSSGGSNKSKDASGIATTLAAAGIWSESQFNLFCDLTDETIQFPERDCLSQDQLKGVTDWKNNIDYENEDGILKFIRVVVMFMGILFLVWMLFIYLCYWMDRINNFVDIDFLPMITGGRLRVSPEEHECTFNPKNFVKGQPQTVNHRAVLSICLIGIFFAVLVITGKLYDVINFIVRKILGWLGLV